MGSADHHDVTVDLRRPQPADQVEPETSDRLRSSGIRSGRSRAAASSAAAPSLAEPSPKSGRSGRRTRRGSGPPGSRRRRPGPASPARCPSPRGVGRHRPDTVRTPAAATPGRSSGSRRVRSPNRRHGRRGDEPVRLRGFISLTFLGSGLARIDASAVSPGRPSGSPTDGIGIVVVVAVGISASARHCGWRLTSRPHPGRGGPGRPAVDGAGRTGPSWQLWLRAGRWISRSGPCRRGRGSRSSPTSQRRGPPSTRGVRPRRPREHRQSRRPTTTARPSSGSRCGGSDHPSLYAD